LIWLEARGKDEDGEAGLFGHKCDGSKGFGFAKI
jgi:hypothetical protein